MAGDDNDGRWHVADNDPFNAGLSGFSTEHFRFGTGSNTAALVVVWIVALLFLWLAIIGPSIILGVLGCLLLLVAVPMTVRRRFRRF